MSPEQARGEVLDHRTDVFGLGIVLYEMVTGELLYKDDDEITLLSQVQRAEVEPPSHIRPEIPQRLEDIIMGALVTGERYPSATLQRDLARFLRQYNSSFSRSNLVKLMQDMYAARHPPTEQARSIRYATSLILFMTIFTHLGGRFR